MIKREVTIENPSGLHARPASILVSAAKRFESRITIAKGGKEYSVKSMVMVLTACVTKGACVELIAEGPDEEEAIRTLVGLIQSGLGE